MKKPTPLQVDKTLTLGADPEFVLIQADGGVRHACNVIRGGTSAKFGIDGGSVAVEIRPTPSKDPAKVVESIQNTLKDGARRYPGSLQFKWHAGGSSIHPIGGHIHFGTNYLGDDYYCDSDQEARLVRALDRFLAIPLLAVEDKSEARSRRGNTSYGQLTDWRTQDWGCEYRTPGSWITSPAVSLAALSLAKVVACESISGRIKTRDMFRINTEDFRQANIALSTVSKAWDRIEKMAMYPKYKGAIQILRELLKSGKTWQAGDIKNTWGLVTPRMLARMNRPAVARGKVSLRDVWTNTRPTLYRVTRGAA